MSAPKRTYTSRPPSSASDGREEWLATFRKNVSENGTARRAWEMLERAGLETAALQALWTYANPPDGYVAREQEKVQHVNRKIKALIRADKIAQQKHNAGDPRAALFSGRDWHKYADVLRCENPFGDEETTVCDWILRRVADGKGMPGLAAARRAFVSLGPRGPVSDRKHWLFVLLCYAENAGVRLGLERLTALAHCADQDCNLDSRTLARYLASLPERFKAKCREDFRKVPPPPLLPPQ